MAKKSFGRDVDRAMEIVKDLVERLKDFIPGGSLKLKSGLISLVKEDDPILKILDDASEEAHALLNKLSNIKHKIDGIKPIYSTRFAKKVVTNFLEEK